MKKTRVLHAIQNLNYGGMERLIAGMVRLADHDRYEMHILVLQYLGRFSAGLDQYAQLHVAPRQHRWSMLYPSSLARTIADIAPDIVHTHSGVWVKVARAARMARVPFTVHTEHGRRSPDPWGDRVIDGFASRYTDRVVAVSQPLANHLISKVGVAAEKVSVVINGVDTEQHRPGTASGALRQELGLSAETPILGSVGRLEPIKGYDVAIRAMKVLEPVNGVAPVLVVGGDGSDRPQLTELVQELQLDKRVFLLGWRDDIERIHAESSLFTMTSRSEGTSVSLLEAMSAGVCPVVTDVGGNAAVLGPELQHRLVPSEDPVAMAAAWRAALVDDAARRRDAAQARQRVQRQFSLERMVRSYEQIYLTRSPAR
jgi:glycosyltransferase involved in cell wall biosynthesis